jgi:pyruvate dehydrogenase E2 component (dihydrolipoamide acetyltransferase)
MPIEVVMPKFGLTMQEGTIQQWFKAEGETIRRGEALFEVETEKVLYEVEAPADGVVAKLLYPVESTVPCARPVAVIALAGEDAAEVAARFAVPVAAESAKSSAAAAPGAAAGTAPPARRPGEVVATPAARKLAKDHGLDLGAIAGSGPGGRVTREDVEAALAAPPPATPRGKPLAGMRKTIAERMWKSLQATAQLTIHTEADVTALVARYPDLKRDHGVTYTDLLVAAVAATLRAHPRVHVTVESDAIVPQHDANVGVAVALDEGLVVPVIKQADRKPLRDIAAEGRRLAEAARTGTLTVDDVSGGTFTITNLGMYGIDGFTPIINQPQVAILGVGRIVAKPAVHEGKVEVRSMMTLSLTFDHRIVDGVPAAAFLRDVVERLAGAGDPSA